MSKQKKLSGPGWWSIEKKIQTVTTYLALGNAPMTEAITGVPRGTIRQWKMQNWWKEMEADIRNEEDCELDVKLSKVIDKSLDAVLDRVENGDYTFNHKTGKFERKPVHMRDALQAATQVFDKRNLLRGKPTSRVEKQNVNDNLAKLAAEFAKFAASKTIEGEIINERLEENSSGESPVERKETGQINAEDSGTVGKSIESQGEVREVSLCNSDSDSAEGGRLGKGITEANTERSCARQYDSSGESQGSSSEGIGEPQILGVQVQLQN